MSGNSLHCFAACVRSVLVSTALLGTVPMVPLTALAQDADPTQRADSSSDSPSESLAGAVLDQAGFHGGLIVHLGTHDGRQSASLRRSAATQVHGLVWGAENVDRIRAQASDAGDYGEVSVDRIEGTSLPYVDNLVNLLVVDEQGGISNEEAMRVLVPEGVMMTRDAEGRWQKQTKPRPKNIDQWSHYLHDASGNSVAHDDVVGPPRHLQWVGSPRWSRHHDRMASMSALVSTGGRMFYIMDEGSRMSIQMPSRWKLIARDAFNGVVLWKRDIPDWQNHLWPLKSGPSQLARRLVSSDTEVYATLGVESPTVALDAITGKTLRTYEGSAATEEILLNGDRLFVVARKSEAELADYAPLFGTVGDQARVRDFFWNEQARVLMAFDVASAKKLWSTQTTISPLSLAADPTRLYFHDGDKLVSLDQSTGKLVWQSESVSRRKSFTFNFGPRLVVHQDVVLFSGGDGTIIGVDSESGDQLWNANFPNSGYQSPQDLMVVDGLVWLAPLTSGKDSGVYTGRDPRTGKVVKSFAPDVDTYWFHHRCYIAKATDNYLMPSRTGIEFVDPKKEHWDINHWVRGGCLYGVMPCNGLTYAPPHNCACYPEAKLFGFNALAPLASTRPLPAEVADTGRLEQGPAYASSTRATQDAPQTLGDTSNDDVNDWPMYRHDQRRTGSAVMPVPSDIQATWKTHLGGRLTSPVIARGRVYVARCDHHTLHAMSQSDGEELWTFTAGGRIDSPPTIQGERVVFGCADGWVYALQSSDGQLIWRYRAAPLDRRTMAYEQLESLWPVHGSVLIHEGTVFCVAGRSNFLDGGLRMLRLELASGKKLSETVMDETNPETGNNLQEKLQILQMPVGLPDILSCDGTHVWMKSQKFDLQGNRLEIGPNSGEFAKQASKQRGVDAHLFAPMGFLDDSWFHRSYWVHGQSFAGGHGGYYQAGRFAPSGRIMVAGNGYVFGYGRKPQYLRWTTVLEHQLFAAEPNPPEIPENFGKKQAAATGPHADFPMRASLNPANKAFTIEAWFTTTRPDGVIVARGGPADGFALAIRQGQPEFLLRSKGTLTTIRGPNSVIGGWHHIAGVIDQDAKMRLYIDGEMVSQGQASSLIDTDPKQGMQVGADNGSSVGTYNAPGTFTGIIDEVRMYMSAFDDESIARRFKNFDELSADAVLAVSFDDGTARDHSLARNDGTLEGGKLVQGKFGKAIQFSPTKNKKAKGKKAAGKPDVGNSLVTPKWAQDVPVYVRGMAMAGFKLFIIGPPDMIDEEETFEKLTLKDPDVEKLLAQQDAALRGSQGSQLLIINTDTGKTERTIAVEELPVWDGLASAGGQLFLTTLDGNVICFSNKSLPSK